MAPCVLLFTASRVLMRTAARVLTSVALCIPLRMAPRHAGSRARHAGLSLTPRILPCLIASLLFVARCPLLFPIPTLLFPISPPGRAVPFGLFGASPAMPFTIPAGLFGASTWLFGIFALL
jgi:hypothetical protein